MPFELGRFDLQESWRRSEQFGLSPDFAEIDRLPVKEIEERRERLHFLFQTSKHVFENLYFQLKKSPFMVIVTDVDGYIVSTWGDSPFVSDAKAVALECGVNWAENKKGTNAIGTSIMEKRPIQVIGEEHFVEENKFLTCYAAPIYSPAGEMLAILDVSGDARFHHPHTLGMVIASSYACQSSILLNSLHNELVLTIKETDCIVKRTVHPIISLDDDGLIKRINQPAAHLLNEEVSSCIGKPLSNWIDEKIVQNLLSGKGNDTVEFVFRNGTKLCGSWAIEKIADDRRKSYRVVMTSSVRKKPLVHPVCSCPKMQKKLELAINIAPTNAAVLIYGETGTGKEVMAREIHEASKRQGPFVAINCAALPSHLIESELFGYVKGAFTGANEKGYKGKVLAAHGGTLFLDEIGEMSIEAQAVLLRVLEEKKVTPLGSNQPIPADVRIIAATNRNLREEIEKKRFREDLYYRLSEIEIELPPLRERQDLLKLAQYFLQELKRELNLPAHIVLHEEAEKLLRKYHWPGNIRELKHKIRQAVYHAFYVRQAAVLMKEDFSLSLDTKQAFFSWEEYEQKMIAEAIQMAKGNLTKAAEILNIGRTTLYRKLNQYPELKKLRHFEKK